MQILLFIALWLATVTMLHAEKKISQVLFIGNSYSFHVPKQFEAIAQREGQSLIVQQVTHGGWTLKQHSENAKTLATLSSQAWDAIVFQEQSVVPSLPANQRDEMMLPALKKLIAQVKQGKPRFYLYQSWGRRDGDQQNAKIFPDDTYERMQLRLNAGFANAITHCPQLKPVPVNVAWHEVNKNNAAPWLYANDGSHPSPDGNYLAAAVFYCTLYQKSIVHKDQKMARSQELNAAAFTAAKRK